MGTEGCGFSDGRCQPISGMCDRSDSFDGGLTPAVRSLTSLPDAER